MEYLLTVNMKCIFTYAFLDKWTLAVLLTYGNHTDFAACIF